MWMQSSQLYSGYLSLAGRAHGAVPCRTWSDCNGDVENVFNRDELLTNVSIYWCESAFDAKSHTVLNKNYVCHEQE